jgi:hypothetical protein
MRRISVVMVAAISAIACNDSSTAPIDTTYDNPLGTYPATMIAIVGTGEGGMSVTPKAIAAGYFDADIKVRLRKGKPNTTYTVQRAPEIGRDFGSNGVCERALNIAPWSSSEAPAAAFLTFVPMGVTTPATFTTTAAGDGMLDFEFAAPAILKGTRFDVMFRLVDDGTAPTSVLLSQCVTVTVL